MRPVRPAAVILASLLAAGPAAAQSPLDARSEATLDYATFLFSQERITESVAEFDALIRLSPDAMPHLWQRGIALYYAGRYDDCRKQFEAHRAVNPNDVENAAWHFLCVARAQSPERARAALLSVGPDARTPMREIYQMFGGTLTPDQVLAAAGSQPQARFYAHLYAGLHAEALGNAARALDHLTAAAAGTFAPAGGYMHMVARVHLARLQRRP